MGDEGVKGEKGVDGTIGADGDSAYDIYVNTTADNPPLGDIAWLESLKGDKGEFTPVEEFYTKGQSDGRFVHITGDTVTGTLKIVDGESLEMLGASPVKTRHLDSGDDSNLQINRNGERRILVGTDEVVLDKIAKYNTDVSVVDDKHLATKKYIDEKVTELSNLSIQVTNDPNQATTNIFYNPDTKMLVMKVD